MKKETYPKLRQVIRESIKNYIRDIDTAGDIAALEAKIEKVGEEIETRRGKISQVESADFADLVDQKKLKEIQKEITLLEKSREKFQAELDKLNSKNVDTKVDLNATNDEESVDLGGLGGEMDGSGMASNDDFSVEDDMSGMGGADENPEDETSKEKETEDDELAEAKLKMQALAGIINEVDYSRHRNKRLLK